MDPTDPISTLGELWKAVQTAGPFASMLLLFMWWLERADRLRLQTERDALLERVINTMNRATDGATATVEAVRNVAALVAGEGKKR